MKKYSSLLVTICLLFAVHTKSEAQISFSKEYGGAYNEDGRWMEQMPDSGFILAGGTSTYSNGQNDIWLVRTDAYGNTLWTKSIGGTAFDFANMVKVLPDGFIICGLTNQSGSDDAMLVRTDLAGNTQWSKVLVDTGIQEFEAVIPTSDGGFACTGVNYTHGTQYYDISLVKFDAAGNTMWEKNIGGQSYEIGNSIQQTADGGYIIGGQTYSYGNLDGDYYLVKTNSTGDVMWEKTYAFPHIQEAHYVQITPDHGYILVGDADTLSNGLGDTDVWLLRTDSTGNVVWSQIFGGSKKDGGKTVENTTDGGFIIGGITRSFNLINPNYYLVKTDGNGTLEWEVSTYGTSKHDHGYRALETSDNGYAIFGFFRNAANYENYGLVKLGPNGGVNRDIGIDDIPDPNPSICRSNNVHLSVLVSNYGTTNEVNVPITLAITSPSSTTYLSDTLSGSIMQGTSSLLTFIPTYDFNVDGTYTLKAYTPHRNADISYTNDTTITTVIVLPPTGDPVTTSAVNCSIGSLTLSSQKAAATDSMFWYDAQAGGNLVSAGSTFTTPSLSSTTTYYVQSVKGKGSKTGPVDNNIGGGASSASGYLKFDSRVPFKLVSVKVFAPSAGSRTIQLRNSAGTTLLSKTVTLPVGESRVYLDFDVPQGNDFQLRLSSGSSNLMYNNSGAVYPYSVSQTLEIYGNNSSNASTYYYFYDWYVFVANQDCGSNLVPVQAIIGSGATSAFDKSRCGSGTVNLTANSGSTLQWYNASSGGSLLATGNSFTTPSLSSTTTYYLQSGSCPNRIAVDAVVNTVSSPPVSSDVTRCGPGSVALTATSSDPVYWYDAAANGTIVGSGTPFNTPFLNSTRTYYARAGSTCPSTPVPVQAIINAAAAPTVNGAFACGPASVTLTAASSNPVAWYSAQSGGSPITTTYNFTTPILASPTTYYAEAVSSCPSSRVPVLANIVVVDSPVGSPGVRCGAGTVVLSAQSTGTITWWSALTGGTQLGSGPTFTTPSLALNTIYYAQATASGCSSTRTAVQATVNGTQPPSSSSAAHCGTGHVTLTATASDSIFWFSAATGGTALANGPSFTTPTLSTTTTYYVQSGGNCPSARVAVDAVITSQAADPVTTTGSRCGTGVVSLTATSTQPISWFDAATGGTQVGTGATFLTPSISSTTTYYAVAGITGCTSNAVATIATVNPLATDPVVTGNSNCGPATLNLTSTASDPVSWYSAPTGGAVLTTGSSYSSNFTTTTTVYVEANNGTCPSNRIPVVANIWSNPVVNLGPPSIAISTGQSVTLDAGQFTSYLWSTSATTRTINVNSANTYFVSVTDNHGCHGSDTIVVNVINGISSAELDKSISVYPNPSDGRISIHINNSALNFHLQLTDVAGRILLNDKGFGIWNKNYDLSDYAKGIYYLKVYTSEGNVTRPFIIQ